MYNIYFDNAATTCLCESAKKEILNHTQHFYANANSLHKKGLEATEYIEESRKIIAETINAKNEEIYFTPGGTYSNNMAIIGVAEALKKRGNRIITTSIEHDSVLNVMKHLEQKGFEIIYLNPDKYGKICLEDLRKALNTRTILVSIMYVNNELGTIEPIEKIKMLIKKRSPLAVFHTDCVGAYGKININTDKYGIDLLSISSHKVHGPTGIGALYISKNARILPIVYGGGQEKGISPGTMANMLIGAFSKAVEETILTQKSYEYVRQLNQYFIEKLNSLRNITINSPADASPYIINFSAGNIRSETLVNFMSAKGICISAGSACAKGIKSHVLKAVGLPDNIINSAVRVSLCRYNTKEEIDIFMDSLEEAMNTIATSKNGEKI